MGSSASLNRAADDLFRHLHEPEHLRRNPLVGKFFESPGSDPGRKLHTAAALGQIHDMVRHLAEQCREADLMAGREERALRQHTIVVRQCLGRCSIGEIAAALAISTRQCYRERAAITRRVARLISEYEGRPTQHYLAGLDAFQFLADRVMHRSALGDMRSTLRQCDDLIHAAPSMEQRISALHTTAFISMQFGNVKHAKEACQTARTICTNQQVAHSSSSWRIGNAYVAIMQSRLALYDADVDTALRMAKFAAFQLDDIEPAAHPRANELHAETLFEIGRALCNAGNVDEGYDYFISAEAKLHNVRATASHLRTRVAVQLWRLRNSRLMNLKSWFPSAQRLAGLKTHFRTRLWSRISLRRHDCACRSHGISRTCGGQR